MSLAIQLQNTSTQDQEITLFEQGSVGANDFTTLNQTSVAQSQFISVTGTSPTSSQVFQAGKFYYESVFNTSGYYFGSVGTILGFSAIINGLNTSYVFVITSVANRTLTDIQTLLTNSLRNAVTRPRPNAQVILNVTTENGVQYLNVNVLDNVASGQVVTYTYCRFYCTTINMGVGGSGTQIFYDQAYTTNFNPVNTLRLSNYPNTTFADSDGWITFQGYNMTIPSFVQFKPYDSYLQAVSLSSSFAYQFEFQLTQVLSTGGFQLLNQPTGLPVCNILGSTTNIQTFSGVVPISTANSLSLVCNAIQPVGWSGQIKMRIRPMAGLQAPYHYSDQYILNQTNTGSTFVNGNPNVVTPLPTNGVGLQQIIQSTIGQTYKVTSLYIFSTNENQLKQPITFGRKDTNGNITTKVLPITIDPYQKNTAVYRTNGMDDFTIDPNCLIQFTLKAESGVNMKMDFVAMTYDEIKEMAIGIQMRLEYAEKEAMDKEKAEDFNEFYLKQ